MHVCLIFHIDFPQQFSTAMQELVRHLTDHIDVTVIAAGDQRETFDWHSATVHTLVSDTSTAKSLDPTTFGIRANRLLNDIHDESPVDVVHLHAFPALGAVLTTTPDIPVLVDIRGTAVSNRVFEALSRWGLRMQRYLVDGVTTVSEPVARHVFGSTKDIYITPLGVDIDRFDPGSVEPIRDLDNVTAIYVGHLHPARELETLVEAIAIARDDIPELECLIVGDGAGRESLEKRAAAAGVNDVINFVGTVDHVTVPQWLVSADIGLAYVADKPQYRHQPPIKTVEYLATGLPVVATATEGNESFISDTTGIVTADSSRAYGNGIRELTERYDEFETESLRGSVQQYDYATIVRERLLPTYESLQ